MQEKEKHKSPLDKIIMGAIIGTAIGSVLGISLAPKKGEETREQVKEIGKVGKETAGGIWRLLMRLIFGRRASRSQERMPDAMKEIPNEMEAHHNETEKE